MRDCEIGVMHRVANQPRRLQPPFPDLTRDIRLDSCAVPFSGNLARAMPHLGQRFERPLDVAVRGLPIPLDAGHNRASVPLLLDPNHFQ